MFCGSSSRCVAWVGLQPSVCVCVCVCGGGGYSDTYVGSFFWFKILNFNIFWGFQKSEYILGYEDFVDMFLGSSQNWTIFRGHFYTF